MLFVLYIKINKGFAYEIQHVGLKTIPYIIQNLKGNLLAT